MKFAQTFIKHHVMTILLYILVVVFGFYSFQNLTLALMPSMEVPAAVVYLYIISFIEEYTQKIYNRSFSLTVRTCCIFEIKVQRFFRLPVQKLLPVQEF